MRNNVLYMENGVSNLLRFNVFRYVVSGVDVVELMSGLNASLENVIDTKEQLEHKHVLCRI